MIKENWKKILKVLILSLSLFLVGCNNSEEKSAVAEITYSIWDPVQLPGMQEVAKAFNEQNDDIHVNVEVTPWDQYWTKLESSAKGGKMPDVFWMHSNEIAKYSEGDVLMDLSEVIEDSDEIDISSFPEELVELYTDENQQLGIPKDYSTIGLWYNKDLFDEAGINYPDETWTWDTLLEASIELTNKEDGIYGFLAPLNREEGYHNFIYQNGGQVLSDDKKQSGFRDLATVEAVQWYVDLSLKHGVSPTAGEFSDNSDMSYFQSGRAAMSLFGSWMTAEIASNENSNEFADVAVLPAGEERATIFNGLANSISANTNHPEAAIKFLEFLSSEEGMTIQGKEGGAIPALYGADTSFTEAYPQFNTEVFIKQMDYREIKPYSKNTVRWEYEENDGLIPVFLGETTVDEISEQLVDNIERILEAE